jgi:small GTP-binding protein
MPELFITSIPTITKITNNKVENDLEIIQEKSTKKKEEIIDNLDKVLEDYEIGEIYEIFGELDIKILVIYISQEKLKNVKKFDNRTITNIYGDKINDEEFMKEKLRYILSIKDCYFNQRTLEFKNALDGSHIMSSNQLLNILLVGPSRAGKSTLCNTLLNKYEALESSATESVTDVVNEYSNEYFHIYDTPGITITKNKGLGDTSKNIVKLLKKIIKKADDSIDDIHVIFFVLKYNPNVENMKQIFQFLDKENEKRSKENLSEIPIIFIINEQKDKKNEEDEDDEIEDINKFEQTARGLKNYWEKNTIKTLYSNYTDHEINEEEDHNIIRVDIRKEKNAINRIFKKLYFYIRKNNPFSPKLFEKMGEIKNNFEKINAIKKRPNLSDKEKDRVNEELKKNKEECQKIILQIREENSFYNKIYSLENILQSSEIKATIAISICCVTTFGTGFIPIPFLDIPLVYTQQAVMILSIAFSYGFSIDEIPFKAAVGAAFGISVSIGGGAVETAAHIGVQKGGKAIIEKTITQAGEKFADKFVEITAKTSIEMAGRKASEKVGIKLIEEGGKEIQEYLVKLSIKEGGIKITEQVTEKTLEYGTGILTKKVSTEIIKEGGEIIGIEIGKQLTNEAGEEIGKMTTSKITKEIATELMKQSGKKSVTGSAAEASKIIPLIGTIIGGSISGSINLASTIGMGLAVRKFFRYLVCLTAGANYILTKKKKY